MGILVGYGPLYANDEGAAENLACSYSTGVRSATIFFIGYKHGADCPRFYKFGSVAHCAGRTNLQDGVCLWSRGLIFPADND